MSETQIKKLNLKALKSSSHTQDPQKDSPLDLSSKGENLHLEKKDLGKQVDIWENLNIKKGEILVWWNKKEKEEEHPQAKISLGMIKKDISSDDNSDQVLKANIVSTGISTEEKQTQKDGKKEKGEEKISDQVHFQNYESIFKKQSSNILKKLRDFKYAPKTRLWLVLWLIGITSIIIGWLMILVPEKHSLSIYKASILEIWTKVENKTKDWNNKKLQEVKLPPQKQEKTQEVKLPPQEQEKAVQEKKNIQIKKEQKEKLKKYLSKKYSS